MKINFAPVCAVMICAACSSPKPEAPIVPEKPARTETVKKALERVETTPEGVSTAATVEAYKQELAKRISEVNSTHVYTGRPQALLRSVIVVRYSVDREGKLAHSEIVRTNHDKATEATALSTLKKAAPFPMPAAQLMRRDRVELSETWLFNKDGRFQLRSVAQPQMNE